MGRRFALEVAERGEVRRRPENGRQEDQEDELGAEPHGGDARHDAEEEPPEHEEDRIRHQDAPRDGHEDQHGAHQQDHCLEAMQEVHGPHYGQARVRGPRELSRRRSPGTVSREAGAQREDAMADDTQDTTRPTRTGRSA